MAPDEDLGGWFEYSEMTVELTDGEIEVTLENEGSWRLATGEAISHPAEIMGRSARWMHGLTGRAPMKSPGKPSLRRDVERQFWCEIANKTAAGHSRFGGASL